MKIAIVSQPFDTIEPPVDGGHSIPILTYSFATELANLGHDVTVYAVAFDKEQWERLPIINTKINHKFVSFHRGLFVSKVIVRILHELERWIEFDMPPVGWSLYYFPYAIQVAHDIRRRGADVVHIQNFSQYAGIIKAFSPGSKIVLHMHCEWLNLFPRATMRARLGSIDRVICCSSYIRRCALKVFPALTSKIHTLYNGVDFNRFSDHHAKGMSQDVYFIGRVSPEKGVHVLIEAFEWVVEVIPQAQLFIVGALEPLHKSVFQTLSQDAVLRESAGVFYESTDIPPYARAMQDRVAGRLEAHVHFLGVLSHTDLMKRLRSAAVVVQPSVCQEAFGMPVAEAMAMELPVVAADGGGLPEIVEHGVTGLVVARGSVESLAEAMIEVLRSPALGRAMGVAGRRRAFDRFNFADLARQLEDQYSGLLEPPGADPGGVPLAAPSTIKASGPVEHPTSQ